MADTLSSSGVAVTAADFSDIRWRATGSGANRLPHLGAFRAFRGLFETAFATSDSGGVRKFPS